MTDPLTAFASTAKQVWYWPVIRGVIAILFGIIALASPLSTAWSLALVIAIFAIVDGVVEIIEGIRHRGYGGVTARVLLGVLSIIFGVVVLAWPGITLVVLVYSVAVWSVLAGVFQLVAALTIPDVKGGARVLGVLAGLLYIVFGALLFSQPAAGLVTIVWIVGIYALVFGIVLVALGFRLRSLATSATGALEA